MFSVNWVKADSVPEKNLFTFVFCVWNIAPVINRDLKPGRQKMKTGNISADWNCFAFLGHSLNLILYIHVV